MSLAPIPANHVRANVMLGDHQTHLKQVRSRAGSPSNERDVEIKNGPFTQIALNSSTELGNVGTITTKPSRIPLPAPRFRAPSGKVPAKRIRQPIPRAYYHDLGSQNPRYGSSVSPSGSSKSNGFRTQAPNQRSFRGPGRMQSLEDFNQRTMPQGLYPSRSLNNRLAHVNGGLQARGDVQSQRPRSPFAYPTRLKRPGYRSPSPLLVETFRQSHGQYSGHSGEPSTRTTSLASTCNINQAGSPSQHSGTRSNELTRHRSQHTNTILGRDRSFSQSSLNVPAPKPSPSMTSIASSLHVLKMPSGADSAWLQSESPPLQTIFYDYTEGFEDQDNYHNVSMSIGALADQSTSDIAMSAYCDTDGIPENTGLMEPMSKNIQDVSSRKVTRTQNLGTLEARVKSEVVTHVLPHDLSDVPELPEKELAIAQSEVPTDHEEFDDRRAETKSPAFSVSASQESVKQEPFSPTEDSYCQSPDGIDPSADSTHLSRASKGNSESEANSISSVKQSHQAHQELHFQKAVGTPLAHQAEEIPIAYSDLGDQHANSSIGSLGTPSHEDHSVIEHTKILSPTPERSLLSPSNQERFSRILSMDEGLLDLDHLIQRRKGDEKRGIPSRKMKTAAEDWSMINKPWRKQSLYIRSRPSKQSLVSTKVAEESDSESEPELTAALRQTFGKKNGSITLERKKSSPIILKSQLASFGPRPTLSIRRSPAVRRSRTSSLHRKPQNSPEKCREEIKPTEGILATSPPDLAEDYPSNDDKELPPPPQKKTAVVTIYPSAESTPVKLPLDFRPLIPRKSEDSPVPEVEVQVKGQQDEDQTSLPQSASLAHSYRLSASSPNSSRPWNLESSYTWNDQVPELAFRMMGADRYRQHGQPDITPSSLRVDKASAANVSINHFLKPGTLSNLFSPSAIQGAAFRRKHPNLSVIPGQYNSSHVINSSHDILSSTPQQTRFTESFETQSPRISLWPPSSGFEVRSFFSDDSSQMQPRGFRKRLSIFRPRARSSRCNSTDEPRGFDRGLLSSALGRSRASGRSSRLSENATAESSRASRIKPSLSKMMGKVKWWFHHFGGDKIRGWGWKVRNRRTRDRCVSVPV